MRYVVKNEKHIEAELGHGKLVISSDTEVGFRPVELLTSSVASCSGSVLYAILTKQRTEFSDLVIDAEVERNKSEANRVVKMKLNFTVKGKNLNEKRMLRNLEITRRHCGMLRSVEDSIEVEETLTIIEEE